MLIVLFSLMVATVFGIGAVTEYGVDALLTENWIHTVFWSLIGTGFLVVALDVARCVIRTRLAPRFRSCVRAACK